MACYSKCHVTSNKAPHSGSSFLRVKWPEREADCSLSSSAEVKNVRSVTSLPIRLNGVMLKRMINRIFILPNSNPGWIARYPGMIFFIFFSFAGKPG
jgi:hypothetical protein